MWKELFCSLYTTVAIHVFNFSLIVYVEKVPRDMRSKKSSAGSIYELVHHPLKSLHDEATVNAITAHTGLLVSMLG